MVTHHLSINGLLDKKTLGTASVTPCDSHVATMVDILDIHIKSVAQVKIYLAIIEIAEDLFLFSQDKQNVCVRFLNVFFHVADWFGLKIAVIPFTTSWSGLRLATGQGKIEIKFQW